MRTQELKQNKGETVCDLLSCAQKKYVLEKMWAWPLKLKTWGVDQLNGNSHYCMSGHGCEPP